MNKIKYLFVVLLALSLTGCDEGLPQEELDFLEENGLTLEKKPSIGITDVAFSPDNKYFTVSTQILSDIGPYALTDSNSVRVDVKESVNGIPQHRMLPVLTAVRNTEAETMASSGIKMQVLVDLTLPQESINRQHDAVAEMLTCFNPDNLCISFMYGDSITSPVKATNYVMRHYFYQQNADYKYLYRAVLQKKEEMEASQGIWADTKGKLLIVFSDEQVYLNDDLPMDPQHFDLQEELLKSKATNANNSTIFYVSMNANQKQDDNHVAGFIKLFCQNNRGFYQPNFNWVAIKDSVFNKYHLDLNSNEFDFVNPDFKIYRGNRHILTLDFYNVSNDSLIASASTQIHKGSIYEPIIVHGHDIWYVILQGILLGLLLLGLVYVVFQFLIPFIRYRIFLKKHVITYTGPLMSTGNKTVSQSCYLCKAPFREGDHVVVKCSHSMHKSCWDENDYHCPEYGAQCPTGSHYYDHSHLHDFRNSPYYLPWLLIAIIIAIGAWTIFLIWAHFFSSHILEGILSSLHLISSSDSQSYINEFSEHEKQLPAFGLSISFLLTIGFSALAMFRRNVKNKWLSIFTRAIVAGLGSMIGFIIIGAIESIYEIDSFSFLVEWIPWTLTAFLIAYASTRHTRIHLQKRMLILATGIAILSMLLWSFFVLGSHLDFRVLLLFTYFIFSIGLALCIAEPVSKSGRYFLRVEGPIKTMEIALYKWFDAAPHQSVTIGKSVNCNLQMSWDLNGNIAPLQAEIKTDGIAIFLHVVEDGVELPGKQLVAGKSVQLYHQSQFRIGQTTFTYIEKDLC